MDPGERKALDDIAEYGCHIIHVLGAGEDPPFSYSVGVQKTSGAPEIVVIGLNQSVAHFMVNEYNRRVRNGERFKSGRRYNGFLEGFQVQFELVSEKHFDEYFGWMEWLYGGKKFQALQILYPTTNGIWPWEDSASDWFRRRQPVLRDHPVVVR